MNAIAEIDKSGRLVVPKKLRDALHLVPGTRLTIRREGRGLTLEPEAPTGELVEKNGLLVYKSARPLPPEHVDWVNRSREDRADQLFNL